MIAFFLGVVTSFIILFYIFDLLQNYIMSLNLKDKNDIPNEKVLQQSLAKEETIIWANHTLSQIFTHFRGESQKSSIEHLNQTISNLLPSGFHFYLNTIGEDISLGLPQITKTQDSDSKIEFCLPFKQKGLLFTIFTEIDKIDDKGHPIQIPLFEFDIRNLSLFLKFKFEFIESTYLFENSSNVISNCQFSFDKSNSYIDMDATLIVNQIKICFTNCPFLGQIIKSFLAYFVLQYHHAFQFNLSDINIDQITDSLKTQKLIPIHIQN